ncbi:MAG TPA: DNA repair protein RadC [Dictyobacter sp.]|jgi:DNA repair protein RadC|nr:DNA repair protein RadC [Dictyobacter sp.]
MFQIEPFDENDLDDLLTDEQTAQQPSPTTTETTPYIQIETDKVPEEHRSEQAEEYHTTVHDIPPDDRPRERLQRHGPETLSTPDLLAIILRTGTQKENVIELASKILSKYGGLSGLIRADFHELSMEYGLGTAKTSQLKAALEIGKRIGMLQAETRYRITSVDDAARLVRMEMMYLDHEELYILLLDMKNQVVDIIKRYKGTVSSSVLRIAEIVRPAITRNCPRLIICHNHPSGDPHPSPEDILVTQQLVEAGKILDIDILDHIIIGNPRYLSLKEQLHW